MPGVEATRCNRWGNRSKSGSLSGSTYDAGARCSADLAEEDARPKRARRSTETNWPISIPIAIAIWKDKTGSPNQAFQATLDSVPERDGQTRYTGAAPTVILSLNGNTAPSIPTAELYLTGISTRISSPFRQSAYLISPLESRNCIQ